MNTLEKLKLDQEAKDKTIELIVILIDLWEMSGDDRYKEKADKIKEIVTGTIGVTRETKKAKE